MSAEKGPPSHTATSSPSGESVATAGRTWGSRGSAVQVSGSIAAATVRSGSEST